MARRRRLDTELVRRGLVDSRSAAQDVIARGLVVVGDVPTPRAATLVDPAVAISLVGAPKRFVSRAGDKLDGALDRLAVDVAGRGWLDAGASMGGFTDCLLQRGARGVIAVDVGYGQLDLRVRDDPRVTVLERKNVRELKPEDVPWVADGVVADLSFISLTVVLPALRRCATDAADFVLLVKPQFEAGRAAVGSGGVVRDPDEWRAAIERVVRAAADLDLGLAGATYSEPPGPAGNREFFVHLQKDATRKLDVIDGALQEAP
ncbi:MAG: TlyA family RNA methyltransferase [Actinomycetota bacterium]|nr:TlyA family RNA methyltransferase [Actinomycetota bacterium]